MKLLSHSSLVGLLAVLASGCVQSGNTLEAPFRIGSKALFGKGAKGQCLERVRPPGKVNLLSEVTSSNKQNLAISNTPPIMTGREGAIAFWIKNSSPYYNTVFDTYDFHLNKEKNRIAINVAPVDAKGPADSDLSKWKRGQVKALIIGRDRKKYRVASAPFNIKEWNHATLTWDKSEMNLYLNGKKAASKTLQSTPDLYLTDAFFWARSYMGDIDEAVIFDRKLDQNDIARLNANKDVDKMKGLVFYMPFEGDLKFKASKKPLEFKEPVISFPRDNQGYFPVESELSL